MTARIPGLLRREIENCLLSYTRGIDRLDGELVAAAFHAGAELEGYGRPGTTTIEAFVERAIPSLRDGYTATQHRISNTSMTRISGKVVLVETYVLAFHTRPSPVEGETTDQLLTFNGRYLDRFEARNGRWRISHRELRADWTRVETIDAHMPGEYIAGDRDRTDPSYLR